MGIKIILTESQLANLEKRVGEKELGEMRVGLACTDLSYYGLVDFLGGKPQKKLGNNTIVHMVKPIDSDQEKVAVKYHGTNIIMIDSEDVVTLNTGTWTTNTTKDRLNQFLNCRGIYIFQKNHQWYIKNSFGTQEFEDGMEVLPDGQVQIPGQFDPGKIQTYLDRAKSLDIDPKFRELYGLSDN